MIATMLLSALFGLTCFVCLACAVVFVRHWHRREPGSDAGQWHSVRRTETARSDD